VADDFITKQPVYEKICQYAKEDPEKIEDKG
jgi:hypothetical protein